MKKIFLFILGFAWSQGVYEGEITFDYSGTVNGSFNSVIQDSLQTGFLFNQTGIDTSYVLMGGLTQQSDDEFDLFIAFLRDTIFPIHPRTWSIPGEGDEEDPTNLENIVVLLEGLDSTTVSGLFEALSDSSYLENDSLTSDSLFSLIFSELSENLYFGISGEIDISNMTDSSLVGNINVTLLKPEFHIPPHLISISGGNFNFQQVDAPELSIRDYDPSPQSITLHPAFPNPFNPSTTLSVELSTNESISILIFNINGQLVETVFSGYKSAGVHQLSWDASSQPSGLYFAKLVTQHSTLTTKLLLMK